MIPTIIILAILAILIIFFVSAYNALVGLRNKMEEAFSTMDVYLKKRYDLIPNLVETVKGYAKHEKDTLDQVISARAKAFGGSSTEERVEGENILTSALSKLIALSEAYPNLKADAQFLDLQRQLNAIEQDIAQARKYYNGVVKQLNDKIMMFPSNLVAGMFHFTKGTFFAVNDESERNNVQVQF